MHLAVDAVGAKFGGATTVLLDFIHAALADNRVDRLSVFTSARELRRFDLPKHGKLTEFEIPKVDNSPLERILWSFYALGQQCVELNSDVVLCLSNMGCAPIPCVVFIQQSLPYSKEALAVLPLQRRVEMAFIREMMRFSCRNATHILVQTPVMVRNVQQAFNISNERISYVMPSVELPTGTVAPDHPLVAQFDAVPPNRRLLYVGSDSSYKMLRTLVDGIALVREKLPDVVVFLTLPTNHVYSGVPGVVCCGYLEGALLPYAYQEATLLVMPSLTETVGLPMVEALSVGTPVLAADRPYAHYVCQDAAVYFDPFDPSSFAGATIRVLENSTLRKELSEKASILSAKQSATQPYQRMVDYLVQFASS